MKYLKPAFVLGLIAAATLLAYFSRVLRDQRLNAAKVRPAQDQTSPAE